MKVTNKLETQSAFQLLSDFIGKSNIYAYFKVTYALQCNLTKEIDSKKLHFYSNPTMLLCILSHCLRDYQRLLFYTKRYLTSTTYNVKRLYTIDECLKLLNNKADKQQLWYLTERKNLDHTMTELIFETGIELSSLNYYDEAKEFFEIFVDASNDLDTTETYDISSGLHQIGFCLFKMNKIDESIEYFQKSLEIHRRLLLDPQKDRSLSVTLHCIGCCLMKMDKPNKAMDHFYKSLEIQNDYQMIHKTIEICHLLFLKPANA